MHCHAESMLGPEKWRTISAQAEVIGNFDGRSQRF